MSAVGLLLIGGGILAIYAGIKGVSALAVLESIFTGKAARGAGAGAASGGGGNPQRVE